MIWKLKGQLWAGKTHCCVAMGSAPSNMLSALLLGRPNSDLASSNSSSSVPRAVEVTFLVLLLALLLDWLPGIALLTLPLTV